MDTESKAFRLLDLPTELVNDILGHVPLHHDLLNFALASRFCSSLAIPQHTEYRVIYFHDDHIDEIWTHLAQRPNLAFNIREIHVMNEEAEDEDDLCLGPSWHWPRTFFQSTHDVFPKSTEELHEDMFTALTCMRRLERVHWNWASKESEHLIPKVLEILKGITTLKHLSFNQLKEFTTDLPLEKHPLWAMSAFESLSLDGSAWYSLPRADIGKRSLVTWFHSLSSLQSLRMDVDPFLRCSQKLSLPNLRYLGLHGDTVLGIQMMDFLERHPGIEGLAMSLRRLYTCIVLKDFLPNLKQLACLPAFLLDLQALSTTWDITGSPSWHLEYLNIESGWWNRDEYEEQDFIKNLCDFTYLDRTSLRILSLDVSGSVESLRKLAETFPRIEELQLSTALYHRGRQTTRRCKFSDMILIFPHFHNLRVIHGHSIWMDLSTRVWTDFSHLSPEEHHNKYNVLPIDPVTNFALNACTNPRRILIGKLYTQTDEWTYNTEVNHRVLALARRCRKLERVDSNMTDDDIIWIRRKKLDWGKIKVMADWLGVGKNKADTEWEEVDYTVRERCSKNPFETMPKRYADGI
ncbi:hypothetical protein BDN72DRAFT_844372 [Pluteus cervinus]|uniref:Uncharacterized protein n=1 Tax=Pluteus cervinus TaxID=181527 RepID=A0ACD3ANF2_9AGAR|nr:hypothetical protein BDN72DRAFT_844372 [Pluteus cervinus]